MTEKKICYKVCNESQNDNEFISFLGILNPRTRVIYRIGVEAFPKVSDTPLFAFDSYDNAKSFSIGKILDYPILKCEYEELYSVERDYPKNISVFNLMKDLGLFISEDVDIVYSFWKSEDRFNFVRRLPKGTILVKSLTPLRIIGS